MHVKLPLEVASRAALSITSLNGGFNAVVFFRYIKLHGGCLAVSSPLEQGAASLASAR